MFFSPVHVISCEVVETNINVELLMIIHEYNGTKSIMGIEEHKRIA